jgi:copper chaperone CopZ
MKARLWFGWLLPVLLVLSATAPGAVGATPSNKQDMTTLAIKGMTCGGCVATVKLRLKRTKGVVAYEVSLEKGEAEVTYAPALTNPETIAAAVSETGFIATVKTKADPACGRGAS